MAVALFVACAYSQSPVPSTIPDLVMLTAHGDKGAVSTTEIVNGYHSGDFQVPVTLQPPAAAGTIVRLAWCFKQNGSPVQLQGGGMYLTVDPQSYGSVNDAAGPLSDFVASLPFSYRRFGVVGAARDYPAVSPGSYDLECFIGSDAVMQVASHSPPTGCWGSVVFPVTVTDQQIVIVVPDHRNLIVQSDINVAIVRTGSTAESAAYNLTIEGDSEAVDLPTSLAVFPANASSTLVSVRLLSFCEFRIRAANVEDQPASSGSVGVAQSDGGFSQMCFVGDTIRGPYDCMPIPDGRPRPIFGTKTIYEGSVYSHVLKAGGALPAGANPLIFCGECKSSNPDIPPECAGDPTGQAFVENGRCAPEWNWWPYGNGNSCRCAYEQVKSAKYVMTAGANPAGCPLGTSIGFYIGFSFEPSRICCTWNRIPGADMPGTHQVLVCKDYVVPPPE